ncbi:MAG: lamin tail domain-containing protein [Prevotella sp.]|jgi:hypothetical protein|nr:lamin tail domain-containing protein [Prevotella sp.]
MKKQFFKFQQIFFIALLGVFMFVSCSSDDDDDPPPTDINYSGLVLNEICGLQSPDDDWIEIFNTTDKTIDISSVQIIKADKDGNKKSIYTVPKGTSIAAKGYKVIATSTKELSDGISNTDQMIITLVKPDGSTSIDKFDRDTNIGKDLGHASGGSYARIPNGTGNWSIVIASTRGAANKADEQPGIDYTVLVLNEICGLQEPDDDWIEIYNKSEEDINIGGVQIKKTDENGEVVSIYTAPDGTMISAKGYRVLATLSGELTAGISNSKQVGIALLTPDGDEVDVFNRDTDIGVDAAHYLGGSYARLPNESGDWDISYEATRSEENKKGRAPQLTDYAGIILNEICGQQEPDDDWVEIYNSSSSSINLKGVQIIKTDEEGKEKSIFTFPDASIAPGEYKVIATLTEELTSGISNQKQVGIALAIVTGEIIDSFDRDGNIGQNAWHIPNGSYARIPNITGDWTSVMDYTRGTENKADPSGASPSLDYYKGLVLNEINGNSTKFVELYNKGTETINLSKVIIHKNGTAAGSTLYTIPEGTTIAPGAIKTFVSGVDFTGGISAKRSLLIQLLTPNGKGEIDVFKNLKSDNTEEWDVEPPKYNGETSGYSYGRSPDGTGDWYMMPITQDAANVSGSTKITW